MPKGQEDYGSSTNLVNNMAVEEDQEVDMAVISVFEIMGKIQSLGQNRAQRLRYVIL